MKLLTTITLAIARERGEVVAMPAQPSSEMKP
jgi:hypothetical protein